MDRRLFVRDIDDWELYGKALEAHLGGMQEILADWFAPPHCRIDDQSPGANMVRTIKLHVDSLIGQAAERASRLRENALLLDSERVLTDGELDPENP